jgi:hypothetical protein
VPLQFQSFCSLLCYQFFIGSLAKYTGGQVYHYPSFQAATHGDKLNHELTRDLTRETAWESVMRIRCGKGSGLYFTAEFI